MTKETDKDKDKDKDKDAASAGPDITAGEERIALGLLPRLRRVRTARWIRFAVVSILFFAWVLWMGNPWLLLLWILLADIYLTCYIPWNWWKRSNNKLVRTVMNWVDAIVYALILVYFIFAFIGQNYTIPSSSLEKSLLVGDYLWVNKMVYGPRVPQTPLHFPLAQHTMPLFGGASYLERPQLQYHRLRGLRSIERGDIVVFNYPQGDTVPLLTDLAQGDYYEICRRLRAEGVTDPKGFIESRPETFGRLVWRPVDRRENYVKRVIGLPGERLKIINDTVYINGSRIATPENAQFKYVVALKSPVDNERWLDLGVRLENLAQVPDLDFDPRYRGLAVYSVPLTQEMKRTIENTWQPALPLVKESEVYPLESLTGMFPADNPYGWSRPYMGEIWIPRRGSALRLTLNNLPLYRRVIETYEGNKVEVRDGRIFINGKPATHYVFRMDYYWMMGDNRDYSADSRYWGFVPEDHVIGTPMLVLASFDDQRSLTDGKIRWNRILRGANPDSGREWSK